MDGRLQFNKVKDRRNEVPLINLYEVQVQYENDTYHEFGVYQSTRNKSNYERYVSSCAPVLSSDKAPNKQAKRTV